MHSYNVFFLNNRMFVCRKIHRKIGNGNDLEPSIFMKGKKNISSGIVCITSTIQHLVFFAYDTGNKSRPNIYLFYQTNKSFTRYISILLSGYVLNYYTHQTDSNFKCWKTYLFQQSTHLGYLYSNIQDKEISFEYAQV